MRDIQDKVDASGDLLSANAFNANLINELQDFVTSAGFTLDPEAGPDTDISMFRKSVAIYSTGAMYFNESGAADAYVLTRSGNIAPMPYYFDGMTVIFKPTNDNIGASTINVDSLGVKDLVASDGSALVGGEIVTDLYVMARFRSSTDDFEIVNSSAPGDAATLNGLASDTAATADTIAARDSSGDITANAFESTVATGTAPLTVASTTAVANLNADLLDGQQGSYYAVDSLAAHLAGTETFTGAKTFSNSAGVTVTGDRVTIDSASSAFVILDCGADTDLNQILFRRSGANRGYIQYDPDATAANELLQFFVGGTGNEVARMDGNQRVTFYGQVNFDADYVVLRNHARVGQDGTGDSFIDFWDDNSNVYRSFKWSDTNNAWYGEDGSGTDRKFWTDGDNASVGSGVSGSFTTADAKTVTVTDGIITSIV